MDPLSASFVTFGVLLLLISWFYLLIVSFKDDFTWGLTTLFLPPLSYAYCLAALEKTGSILFLSVLGWILIFCGL
jgi:hypothetical protein